VTCTSTVGWSKDLRWVGRVEADLVSTVVPGNFFAEEKYVFVAEHFFLHRLVQRLSDGHLGRTPSARAEFPEMMSELTVVCSELSLA